MSIKLNPMDLNLDGKWNGNYVQPGTAAPSPVVTVPAGRNVLNVTWPIPRYRQPGT